METTPASVLETFERNRRAVRELLHFDDIVLKPQLLTLHLVSFLEQDETAFHNQLSLAKISAAAG